MHSKKKNRTVIILLETIYITLILCITLIGRKKGKFPLNNMFLTYKMLKWGIEPPLLDIFMNVIIFVPCGIICYWHYEEKGIRPIIKTMLAVFAISLMIETFQFFFQVGQFEVCDLLDNSLGGIFGGILVKMNKIDE